MQNYKSLILAFSIIIFITSCNKNDTHTNVHPAVKTFSYYNNSKIDTAAGNNIIGGSYTVFEFNYTHADDVSIADDEVADRIIFQIPTAQTSFSISESQLTEAFLKRWRYCFCIFVGPYSNLGGSISGIKQNNKWLISGTVKASNTETINISGNYNLK